MNPQLCVGIASKNDSLVVAALESGCCAVEVNFPATDIGVQAIKIFLVNCHEPVRLAVTGGAALSLALALASGPVRETFIVSSTVADRAVALARYAEHTP